MGGLAPSALLPKEFYRGVQMQYPPSLFVPRDVLGRTVTLNFSGGNGTVVISFDDAGGGTYTWTLGLPGLVEGYDWIQDPYRGRFYPIFFSGIIPMVLHLDFDSSTAGTFKGMAHPNYPSTVGSFAVSGIFTSAT